MMIQVDRVSRDFASPDGKTYCALRDVAFEVPAGAFVAIVGPSGCGKSTLLNIVAGLLMPTEGAVRIDGQQLDGLNRRATYMFQQDALLPWKNVRDNVALGLTLAGVHRSDAHARADSWLDRVGLAPFAAHYPAQLSGGMRKRVAMTQNWIIDRDILLMDEPFGALDVHTRQQMEGELLDLWAGAAGAAGGAGRAGGPDRKTILFVTHDLEEAIALADEVVVLSAGPASRVVARHPVTLDRPRDLLELRTQPAFLDLYRELWAVLRDEVIRSRRG
ncbi:MAG TPA: ABC transporter ATP-binding protein [Vicinamibacterales bacterium]|jgi:NitT/TauT family transport system ATP-binding protein|nr:ABC transporter ATP-binding protein [Vicinamibacterales bacterium]